MKGDKIMWEYFLGLLDILDAIRVAATHEMPDAVNYVRNQIGPRARHYWHIFIWLAIVVSVAPIIMVMAGLIFQANWFIPIAGLLLAITLAFLLYRPVLLGLAIVLGVIWSLLNVRLRGSIDTGIQWATVYIKFVAAVLLWELLVIFYLSIVPFWNNPRALPVVALCAALIGLMIYVWGFKGNWFRRLAYVFVIFVLIFETFSFVFPKAATAVGDKRPSLDEKMAKWVENPTLSAQKDQGAPAGHEFVLPAQTGPQGIYTGIPTKAGQTVTLVQTQPELTKFSIVGLTTIEEVSSRSYTTYIRSDGGLYLRPEEGKGAALRIAVR